MIFIQDPIKIVGSHSFPMKIWRESWISNSCPTLKIWLRPNIVTPNEFTNVWTFSRKKLMCPFYYRSQKICSILNATGSVKWPSESGNRRIIHFYCTKMTFLDRQRNSIFAPFGAGKTTSTVIWPGSDSAGRTRRAQAWPRSLGVIAKSWFSCFAPSRKVVATLTIP